jgi:hypothetical protein
LLVMSLLSPFFVSLSLQLLNSLFTASWLSASPDWRALTAGNLRVDCGRHSKVRSAAFHALRI